MRTVLIFAAAAVLLAILTGGYYFQRGGAAAPPLAESTGVPSVTVPTMETLPAAAPEPTSVAAMPMLPAATPQPTALVPASPPKRLIIPAMKVDAGFEFVGLTPNGEMDVPKDPAKVAWYKLGPKPGEKGNAIVAGHVDWAGKLVVFWSLKDLKQGDAVTVMAEDGRKFDFVVQWSRWYDYDVAGPQLLEIFGSTDKTEITLITCGGSFDRASRNYLDRLVVRAVLK